MKDLLLFSFYFLYHSVMDVIKNLVNKSVNKNSSEYKINRKQNEK